MLLRVDGRSDFKGLDSRKHNDEILFYPCNVLALQGEDLRHPFSRPAKETSVVAGQFTRWTYQLLERGTTNQSAIAALFRVITR
ncbi:hypothetical protein [Bradyrhizobium retamae]|uniref:hypothetical protein n=1 Tax=Bradyrhizobium retamae TaxID=1300035 RepID=UPI000AF781F8|nr:hypothetical protein [Bradyrhizobium retamae]